MTIFHVIQHTGEPVWKSGSPRWIAEQFESWMQGEQHRWPIDTATILAQIRLLRYQYDPAQHPKDLIDFGDL